MIVRCYSVTGTKYTAMSTRWWNAKVNNMAHTLQTTGLAPVSAFAEHCYSYICTVGGLRLVFSRDLTLSTSVNGDIDECFTIHQ
jgi:hypothetical protein